MLDRRRNRKGDACPSGLYPEGHSCLIDGLRTSSAYGAPAALPFSTTCTSEVVLVDDVDDELCRFVRSVAVPARDMVFAQEIPVAVMGSAGSAPRVRPRA